MPPRLISPRPLSLLVGVGPGPCVVAPSLERPLSGRHCFPGSTVNVGPEGPLRRGRGERERGLGRLLREREVVVVVYR